MDAKTKDQRTSEWQAGADLPYFQRQFENPYRSTVAFCDWLEKQALLTADQESSVVDLGAGMGATLSYFAGRLPKTRFTGVDINAQLVQDGNSILKRLNLANARLEVGNLYKPMPALVGANDGVISLQTLSWLPESDRALQSMAALAPRWIALTSLFYDGDLDCKIEVRDHTKTVGDLAYKDAYYNIYSLPRVRDLLAGLGYRDFRFQPFEIDIDLEPADRRGMGTYTRKLADGKRLQFSGPVWMSWHFIAASRD